MNRHSVRITLSAHSQQIKNGAVFFAAHISFQLSTRSLLLSLRLEPRQICASDEKYCSPNRLLFLGEVNLRARECSCMYALTGAGRSCSSKFSLRFVFRHRF